MPIAKKLPSGSWRCRVYTHSEIKTDENGNVIYDPKTGKPKLKKIYQSFTSDNPTLKGKAEAEGLASQFRLRKDIIKNPRSLTLRQAIDDYIETSDALLSPTTIQGYRKTQRVAFLDIMDMPITKIDNDILKRAVNKEKKRISNRSKKNPKPISGKTLRNEYGLIRTVLNVYNPSVSYSVKMPEKEEKIKELIRPEKILAVVNGTEIELPVLLAVWLSFSMSEVRGLTKSKSIQNGYITIGDVVVDVNNKPLRKEQAKVHTRIRKHKIPEYIQNLIDQTDPDIDELVPMSGHAIYMRWTRLLEKNNLPHMSFHDLRHVNASVMALLRVPDKYAMERGGWKTDKVMKKVYTHTFSDERQAVDNAIDNFFNSQIPQSYDTKYDTKK